MAKNVVEEKVVDAVKKVESVTSKTVKKVSNSVKKATNSKRFEDKADLAKLYNYVIIVDLAVSRSVEKLVGNLGSSMQFTHVGRGTASKEILNVLGVPDDTKAIINAIVSEDHLADMQNELTIFFAANKKNRGIAFAIPLSSLIGVRIYKYLSQTM